MGRFNVRGIDTMHEVVNDLKFANPVTLNEYIKTDLQIQVLNALQIGKQNAIKMRELKQIINVKADRKIRLAINELRLQKYLVLSSSTDGYWLAADFGEYMEWDNFMTSYIADLSHTKTIVKQGALEKYKDKFQLPLY